MLLPYTSYSVSLTEEARQTLADIEFLIAQRNKSVLDSKVKTSNPWWSRRHNRCDSGTSKCSIGQ